jgi:ATP-dependent Lon protease
MTGELSLTGKMWPVEGLEEKVQGAAAAGLKKAILPPLQETQQPLTDAPAGVEVVHLSTVFEAINHMVIGELANAYSA